MSVPVFIGDELTAAAYRLTGVRTLVPDDGRVAESFDTARGTANLILIAASAAVELSPQRLDEAVRAATPLVLIVPDAGMRAEPPDLDRRVDRILGIEA